MGWTKDQAPAPFAVAVPRASGVGVAERVSVTTLLASAVPVNVSVGSLVIPSDAEAPLSVEIAVITGAAVAASTVTMTAAETALMLPAASRAVAVKLCSPAASVVAV